MKNYVTLDRTRVVEALAWAECYCPSFQTLDYHMDGYNQYNMARYDFFFDLEQGSADMTAFILRWL